MSEVQKHFVRGYVLKVALFALPGFAAQLQAGFELLITLSSPAI